MNQKGILFSVMILFIVLSIMSLNIVLNDINRDAKEMNELSGLISVGNKYRNVTNQMVSLDRANYNKEVFERTLPFDYNLNKEENVLLLEHSFPISQSLFDETFNTLNLLEVFLEDSNIDNLFDDLSVELNVPKNSPWGGNDDLLFLVNPLCYEYMIDINSYLLQKSSNTKCDSAFSNSDFKKISFTIDLRNGDFNSLTCNGGACPNDPYSTTDPYYELVIDDSKCSNCNLSQKTASAHFIPANNFTIQISCVGVCVAKPITITHDNLDFEFESNGNSLDTNVSVTFNETIEDFFIPSIDVLVTNGEAKREG